MSHLPLDARAILHYLNELGYRNISAEQLKEFLKGNSNSIRLLNNFDPIFIEYRQTEFISLEENS